MIVRHPLDNIASVAAKAASDKTLVDAGPSGDRFNLLREQRWREVCQDDATMNPVLYEMSVFLKHAVSYADSADVFRYEDIMKNPADEVARIARFLEVSASDVQIADLASLVGSTDLAQPGHKFRPGIGKWQGLFSDDLMRRTRACGIFRDAQAFGYDVAGLGTGDPLRPMPTVPADLISSYCYLHLLDVEQVRASAKAVHATAVVAGLETTAHRADDIATWEKHVAARPYLRQLLRAMKFDSARWG